MNYDNVNNPFDMYDEQDENNQFDDEFEELDFDEVEEENEPAVPKNSRLMNVIMILSYVLVLILAFFGIVGLCNSETRSAIFHAVFFFM
jgi:hypothetical protein